MPRMKYYDGSQWITLDARDADTVDGKHAADFAPIAHVGAGGVAHALATTTVAGFISGPDKSKLDNIQAGAQVNQNAFSQIKVGTEIIASDDVTDTLEIAAGSGIMLTADLVNDKLTIGLNASGSIATTNTDGRVADSEKIGGKTLYELDLRFVAAGSVGVGTGNGQAELGYNVDSVTVNTASSKVIVPITTYKFGKDVLLVFQNSTFLQNGKDYTYDDVDRSINKITGTWDSATVLDFVAITIVSSGDMLKIEQYESFTTIAADGTSEVLVSVPEFEPGLDGLNVYQDGVRLAKTVNYSLNTDGTKIVLNGYTVNTGTEFQFVVLKKLRVIV